MRERRPELGGRRGRRSLRTGLTTWGERTSYPWRVPRRGWFAKLNLHQGCVGSRVQFRLQAVGMASGRGGLLEAVGFES